MERTDGFIPLLRALVQNEMQTALSRNWTQVNDSNSYDDTHYATLIDGVWVNISPSDPLNYEEIDQKMFYEPFMEK